MVCFSISVWPHHKYIHTTHTTTLLRINLYSFTQPAVVYPLYSLYFLDILGVPLVRAYNLFGGGGMADLWVYEIKITNDLNISRRFGHKGNSLRLGLS